LNAHLVWCTNICGPPGLPLCSVAFAMHHPLEMNACEHVQGGHALYARFFCVKSFGTHRRRNSPPILPPHLPHLWSAAPRSIRTLPGLGRLGGGRFTFAHTAVGLLLCDGIRSTVPALCASALRGRSLQKTFLWVLGLSFGLLLVWLVAGLVL